MDATARNCSKISARLLPAFLAIFLLVPTSHLSAQVSGATMSGTITDASNAIIPNAQISVKNVATGEERSVTADGSGLYSVPNLLPGKYDVTVSAAGFASQVRSGVTLTVGAQQVLNITLTVGEVTQTVQVTSEALTVQLANATLSDVINQTTVVDLPLNGRDWTQLATLQPGVYSAAALQPTATGNSGLGGSARGGRGFGVQLTISGGRPQQNNYRIDGISVNDNTNGGPGSVLGATLGVDAIQEFSVLTSNYSAEYGRTSGGVINAVTKPGSNSFHGDAYEFLRNSAISARNYFDPKVIPPFRRNQFGASAGGPIRKDKTFVFGDFEGFRQVKDVSSLDQVPSLDARNGIIHNTNGTTTTLTVNPLVVPYLAFWPKPNGPLLGTGNTASFTFVGPQDTTENFVSVRVDHKFTDADSLFGSFQYDRSVFSGPDQLGDTTDGSITDRKFVALEETHIFSPRLVNTVRGGFNRSVPNIAYGLDALNPAANDPSLGAVPGRNAPAIVVPGLTMFVGGLNSWTHNKVAWNSFQGYDDAFFTSGIQTIKFGFGVERMQDAVTNYGTYGGNFHFGTLTNFLTDVPSSFSTGIPSTIRELGLRQTILGAYVQDDVRWRPNLTFNLGLRYEMATTPTEANGLLASLSNVTAPQPEVGGPLFKNPTLRNFEPRVGFAWDPFRNGKTSVRGGFGIYDVLPLAYEWDKTASSAPNNLQGSSPTPLAPGSFPTGAFQTAEGSLREVYIDPNPKRNYVMQWNLSIQRELSPSLTATVAYVGSRGVHQVFHSDDINKVQPTLTSAGYLWPFPVGSGTVLNPAVGRMDNVTWGSNSFYDGLEAQITKRMSHGVQIQGSYTWGKCIDEGSTSAFGDGFVNAIPGLPAFSPSLRRALCDFNISQNLIINFTWLIPSPHSSHFAETWALGGWQLGGILSLSTGTPFTPLMAGDPLGQGSIAPFDPPNRLPGAGCQNAVNPGNVNQYIKVSCFGPPVAPASLSTVCQPAAPSVAAVIPNTCMNLMGNAGRNSLIGPGFADLDFSLFKNNYIKKISESFNVQFRVEAFNVLNHPNFAPPIDNSTVLDQTGAPVSGAGLIDSTTNDSREIQLAIKVIW